MFRFNILNSKRELLTVLRSCNAEIARQTAETLYPHEGHLYALQAIESR